MLRLSRFRLQGRTHASDDRLIPLAIVRAARPDVDRDDFLACCRDALRHEFVAPSRGTRSRGESDEASATENCETSHESLQMRGVSPRGEASRPPTLGRGPAPDNGFLWEPVARTPAFRGSKSEPHWCRLRI